MNDVDDKLDELRKEESKGNRLDRDNPQSQPDLADAIEDSLDKVDQGEMSDTITAFDPTLAALLDALSEDDQEIETVYDNLREAYDGNSGVDRKSKSGIIRLAIRVGLQEGSEDTIESLGEAISRYETTTI